MIILLDKLVNEGIDIYYIDLFCGAGGTSTGVELATVNGRKVAKIIICINHDKNAIASHFANHPDALHFTEDIRTLDFSIIVSLVKKIRMRQPNAKFVLWASLECTNFSKAKGGLSRNPDSRTLAEHLYRYINAIEPDLIQIENVEEFLDYGPVEPVVKKTDEGLDYCPLDIKIDKKTKKWIINPVYKPIEELKGTYYAEWRDRIKSFGFEYEHRILNAADYGAYTSRKRLFIQFAKPDMPIEWPERTHSKHGSKDLFDTTLKYKPVKECLDFSDEGESIFDRKKKLVEATLDRVLSGCIIHVAGGKDKWLLKYNSINGNTGKHNPPSVDDPCPTVSTQGRLGVVQASFLCKHFSGHPDSKNSSINEPARAITTIDHHSVVNAKFIAKYYSGNPDHMISGINEPAPVIRTKDSQALICSYNYKDEPKSVNDPCPTLLTKDRLALTTPKFIMNNYTGGGQHSDINKPCPAVTQVPKQNLVQCHFVDQQFGQSKPSSINKPLGALTQNPKYSLVKCDKWLMNTNFNNIGSSLEEPAPTITANRKWHYIVDAQYSRTGQDIERPCFTLIARMDKTPPYLIEASSEPQNIPSFIKIEGDTIIYEIYDADSPKTKEIKEFMALYGLIDIKMRMLRIPELKMIMGFPEDYVLIGSQADQKKFIGNAVEVNQARVLCEAIAKSY
ncbi:DNA cytosine methyltransferase [Dysgonomonas termitidis]|uniref:DNA (cytosine-5-)-methyltransferase n=1 Tax=Dysgonomonas termitidis TaxID=1516126 RepID=A0ABV9L131_9BACT